MHMFNRVLLLVVLCGLTATTQAAENPAAPSLLVQTQTGPVRGQFTSDRAAQFWLGIPFAQAPTGERRWQAPQPVASWTQELQANTYGDACPQLGWIYGPPPKGKAWGPSNVEAFGKPAGSEDCLKLNVWRPVAADGPMPVIVFVHGGANVVGHSADPIYDGKKLALATHAVIVTINYRLGMFGWFIHPSLEGNDPLNNSGNWGTLDIIQALRFVQANVSAFGGDPQNVTLMGQSAGAGNTYSLMGSPLADGLFQKAIVLSGLAGHGAAKEDGYAYADDILDQLIIDDGLSATHEQAVALAAAKGRDWQREYLKSKTSDQLLEMLQRHPDLRRGARVFNDGAVLSADLPAAMEQGHYHIVPTLAGMTRDESKLLFPTGLKASGEQLFTMARNSNPDAAPTLKLGDIVSSWLLPGMTSWFYDVLHWGISNWLQRKVTTSLTQQAMHDPKVFAYRFDWDNAPQPWKTAFGACHACDLPFIFGNFSNNFFSMQDSEKNRPGREALSAVMMNAIATFIRTGDPNNATLGIAWPTWAAQGTQQRLRFDASDSGVELSVN